MNEQVAPEFALPPRFSLTNIGAEPDFPYRLRFLQKTPLALTFYDSFDWRLQKAGFELGLEQTQHTIKSVCCRVRGDRCEVLPLSLTPAFGSDLPRGHWHDRLAKALDVRALMKRAEFSGERSEWAVEDDQGERVVTLELDTLALMLPGDSLISVLPRLRVLPVDKHRKACRTVVDILCNQANLKVAERGYLSEALWKTGQAAYGVAPVRKPISPDMRADAAVKLVLADLMGVLHLNESGVLAETDTEFLHDFRVAVRRTRSVLRQMPGVFPERVMVRFSRQFAELARATGEPRDMDVYLLAVDRLETDFPLSLQGSLEPLRVLIKAHAVIAHQQLNRYLQSAAYRRWMRGWETFLGTPCPRRPVAPNALLPVGELASRRIWKLYRRAVKEGEAINGSSPATDLHELRKTAKKLRYVMDQFHDLYTADRLDPLIRSLKSLQALLGDYQDIEVQIGRLEAFAGELQRNGAPTASLLGIGLLLGRLHDREASLRAGFDERFAHFAKPGQQKRYRRLFLEPFEAEERLCVPNKSDK